MNSRTLGFAAATVAGLSLGLSSVSFAGQTKMAPMTKPAMAKMSGPVYVCKAMKCYMSPMMAKKMGYKDPMGNKLVKMSKAPAGYMDASKMPKKDMGEKEMSKM